jgi:hypothetical protein
MFTEALDLRRRALHSKFLVAARKAHSTVPPHITVRLRGITSKLQTIERPGKFKKRA